MNIQKLSGFKRIYQAECFPDEVKAMFGKSIGEMNRYIKLLFTYSFQGKKCEELQSGNNSSRGHN